MRVTGSLQAVALAGALAGALPAAAPAGDAEPAALVRAREASSELMRSLQGLLLHEIAAGRPEDAIHACSESAPAVAARLSEAPDLAIRRVSLRPRNPENAPDDYERGILERFDRAVAGGGRAEEHAALVGVGADRELRYLRPLVAVDLCLKCHGPADRLLPELKRALAERYPGDTATGYAEGQVRGAVSVRVRLAGGMTP